MELVFDVSADELVETPFTLKGIENILLSMGSKLIETPVGENVQIYVRKANAFIFVRIERQIQNKKVVKVTSVQNENFYINKGFRTDKYQ